MRLPDGAQLGYCTNVHAGESASEVVDSLRRVAVRVREHLGVGSLGLGLYLSHRAASEVEPRKLRDELAGLGLYAFTFNGFPYGGFPGVPSTRSGWRRSSTRLRPRRSPSLRSRACRSGGESAGAPSTPTPPPAPSSAWPVSCAPGPSAAAGASASASRLSPAASSS